MEERNVAEEPMANYGIEYTYADYLKFDFDEMVELIRGKIYKMSPAPRINHQTISTNLLIQLGNFLKGHKCKLFHAPTDVVLPVANLKREKATTVVQPDIFIVCDPSVIESGAVFGVPNLIIEILSPHTKKKDLQNKYDVYEEAGVLEYWIVMPEQKLLEVFILKDGKYYRDQTYVHTDIMECKTIEGITLDLNEVFEGLVD